MGFQAGQAIGSMTLEEQQNDKSRDLVYRDIACRWLRQHATRWKAWTIGWDQKLNLTVAGMFSMYGSWVVPGLKESFLFICEGLFNLPAQLVLRDDGVSLSA
ncbi:unnamed protein product [Echinostoma caproni]|uniref:Uncharacterized protein n=1 Tax=Echinostoma caproni TaxID=27848 RepID=A0A183BCX8_9TREM|nr:unnamed protein product [Echinostoma caproni]